MNLIDIISQVLEEENVAGGESSAFGPEAHVPYGEKTKGDARIPVSIFKGVQTRKGMKQPLKRKKRKK